MSDNMTEAPTVEPVAPHSDAMPTDGRTADSGSEVGNVDNEGSDERGAGSREAAKYRRQLRDVEAQRDQLGERVAAMQRGQAETLAGEHLADGADMFRDGLELTELLDDDGNLDPAKVTAAAKTASKAHPHWAAPRPFRGHPKRGGLMSGATGSEGLRITPSWQGVLNTSRGDD